MRSAAGTSSTRVPPRYTSYASAPSTAFHMTCTVVALPASAVTPVGAPGSGRLLAPSSPVPQPQEETSARAAQNRALRRRARGTRVGEGWRGRRGRGRLARRGLRAAWGWLRQVFGGASTWRQWSGPIWASDAITSRGRREGSLGPVAYAEAPRGRNPPHGRGVREVARTAVVAVAAPARAAGGPAPRVRPARPRSRARSAAGGGERGRGARGRAGRPPSGPQKVAAWAIRGQMWPSDRPCPPGEATTCVSSR